MPSVLQTGYPAFDGETVRGMMLTHGYVVPNWTPNHWFSSPSLTQDFLCSQIIMQIDDNPPPAGLIGTPYRHMLFGWDGTTGLPMREYFRYTDIFGSGSAFKKIEPAIYVKKGNMIRSSIYLGGTNTLFIIVQLNGSYITV